LPIVQSTATKQVSVANLTAGRAVATGALTVTGAATVSTTLGVTGAATLSSTLGVTGATTLSSLVTTTGTISTTPSGSTDIANKAYVDTVAQGLDTKASVVAGTTANITLSGTQTVDGVVLIAGDRVLVKNQTTTANNGLYLCAAGSWTRTTDMDTWAEVPGAYVFVEQGTTLADTGWVCTSDAGGTIGVTAIVWAQFSGAGSGVSSINFGTTGLTPATTTTGAVTVAGTLAVLNGGTGVTTSTGTTNVVLSNSPTLVTPALGTPSALVGTNITGTASGLTAGNVTTNANLTGAVTSVGNATSLGSFTSSQLLSALTDETGTGANVFATSPTLVTPILGTPTSATLTNATGLPLTTGVTGQLPVANGGTGTATPSIVAGTNVTVTGTWPNQTIASSGSGGGVSYTAVKTANYTAANNDGVLTNTTGGAFTVTLPTSPSVGNIVLVIDSLSQWGTNNLTIDPTALIKIAGNTAGDTLVCDITGATVTLVYTGATYGWNVAAQVGGNGGTAVTLTGTQTLTNKTLTSPVLTAPVLGTPASGILTSCTGINYDGFKNRIINGAMVIDQRNAGASVTPTDGQYTLDRYVARLSQASKFSVQQSTTAATGFINSLKVTSASSYSVLAGDYFAIQQNIEGLNCTDLGWGTASAKTVTLSFQVYSSLTGTFGGALSNNSQNRSYPFTYSISTANTWTTISVTIAGDTSGTWLTSNSVGIMVFFGLGMGSTYSGTAGAWAAAAYLSATGATSVVGTNGATFYITGVQLEKSSTATSFDVRDYGRELIMCQRYFQTLGGGTTYAAIATGSWISTTDFYAVIIYSVVMRSAPTIAFSGNFVAFNVGTLGSLTSTEITTFGATIGATGGSGGTNGSATIIRANNSTASRLTFSAEL
jgi:hypothetical protein